MFFCFLVIARREKKSIKDVRSGNDEYGTAAGVDEGKVTEKGKESKKRADGTQVLLSPLHLIYFDRPCWLEEADGTGNVCQTRSGP